MRDKRGFTLIEILVVLLIIGIVSGVAFLAFGDFGASRKIVVAGEQFSSYVKLLQQKAILESNSYGIKIAKNGYETVRLSDGLLWQSMPRGGTFKWHNFPKDSVVVLNRKPPNSRPDPDIIIYPSGDMSEFELMFGSLTEANLITITGKHNGELILTHENNP